MSLLDRLSEPEVWEDFWRYKSSLSCPQDFARELRIFIDSRGYEQVCAEIERGERFPLPSRSVISKLSSAKKRVVYTYPYAENMVLKLLTYLLIRRYDALMYAGLYSFRPGRSAKDAIQMLTGVRGIGRKYTYKADISDYFNSVPVERLLPMLENIMPDDRRLYGFLSGLLTEPEVRSGGRSITERKGIMAGTPLASFYANLYLRDMDKHFAERGVLYARYSDDVIIFADSVEEARACAEDFRCILAEKDLTLNPAKEAFGTPEDGWVFLGFSFRSGRVDIAPATLTKLKNKMRRKTAALRRWRIRCGLGGEKAAAAFIRIFNRKLLEGAGDSELTWSYWFFPVINTTDSLHAIDLYAQECIRYLISDKRTKARYNVRYEDMKQLGYRSLVHEYYSFSKDEKSPKTV